MKSILLITLSLISINALASKARILALGTPMHLVDTQFIQANPIFLHLPNVVVLESGLTTSTTGRNNAEAVATYSIDETSKLGLALGKNDDLVLTGRAFMNSIVGANTYSVPQNMVHLFYGQKNADYSYSVGASYSQKNDKVNSLKESSSGLVAAYKKGQYIAFGSYSLANSVEAAGGLKFDGAGTLRLAGRYVDGELMYGVDLANWGAKSETASVEQQSYGVQTITARVVSSSKKDGNDVFYGAGLQQITVNCKTQAGVSCSTKFSKLMLPLILGVEANANDWLVLRGAVTQSVLLNSTKDEIGLPAASGIAGANGAVSDFAASPNNTVVSAGLGFKFKNVLVDGTLAGATNQNLDAANLISQLGLTFNY